VGWLKEHLPAATSTTRHTRCCHHCKLYQDPVSHAYMTIAMHAAKACPVIEGGRSCPQALYALTHPDLATHSQPAHTPPPWHQRMGVRKNGTKATMSHERMWVGEVWDPRER
jgi:hypothetical protein